MTKARKAPQKKAQKRDIKWANLLFLAIGVIVVLSMVITSLVTQTPQPVTTAPTPPPVVVTPNP